LTNQEQRKHSKFGEALCLWCLGTEKIEPCEDFCNSPSKGSISTGTWSRYLKFEAAESLELTNQEELYLLCNSAIPELYLPWDAWADIAAGLRVEVEYGQAIKVWQWCVLLRWLGWGQTFKPGEERLAGQKGTPPVSHFSISFLSLRFFSKKCVSYSCFTLWVNFVIQNHNYLSGRPY
jgi:hypothetical protein